MSDFIWAIDEDGKITKCTAKPENRGKKSCKHKLHADNGESPQELVDKFNNRELRPTKLPKEFEDYYYEKIINQGRDILIIRTPKDNTITRIQVYLDGEWVDDPDLLRKAEVEDRKEISALEAIDRIKEYTVDEGIIDLCKDIAKELHKDQKDKNGLPYFNHPEAVANRCSSPYTKAIAYLHDTIEDTEVDDIGLELYGIPKSVIKYVQLLSKPKGMKYMGYIENITKDPIASEVKYCDLKHNTDLSRSNGKIMVSKEKWKKYQEALELLNDIYGFED